MSSAGDFRGFLWLAAVSGVLVLVLLGSSSYPAAQPLIVAELGISASGAGFVFAAYQAGYAVGTLVLLPLTDRLDARRVLVASAALTAAASALFPLLARTLPAAALLRAVAGLGLAGVYMPGVRLVSDRFPRRRGTAVGVYVAAFYLGVSLSLAATGALLPLMDWRRALLAIALAAAAAPLLALALPGGTAPPVRSGAPGLLKLGVLTNRPAMLVVLAYAAHSWELYVAWAWLAPYLTAVLARDGMAAADAAGLAAAAAGIAGIPSALGVAAGGALSDRLGRTRSARAILAAGAVGSLALGWLGTLPWPVLIGFVVLHSLLLAADSAIYSAAVTELARPAEVGATQAVQSFVGFTASAVAPVVCGLALDLAGPGLGWGLGFGQAGLVALAGVGCLTAARRPRPAAAGAAR